MTPFPPVGTRDAAPPPSAGTPGGAEPGPSALAAARRALLLDPQTCGPLLAALPAPQAAAALAALHQAGFTQAALIGAVQVREQS